MSEKTVKVIECPRDAMQGWKRFIPTGQKIAYINALLQVGFDTIDFGSFVSPKAIPQLQDTHDVLKKLDLSHTTTKLLAIVANMRGAEAAVAYEQITYLGFPLSVSETFQQRNTYASVADALKRITEMQGLCLKNGKTLVVYLSMGFGNPYGDAYSPELVFRYAEQLVSEGVHIISLADTVGIATPQQVTDLTAYLIHALPQVELGVHLHSTAHNWYQKVDAAYSAGCRRFDGALKGIGGCPMANNDLVGNLNTEWLLSFLAEKGTPLRLNELAFEKSLQLAERIFT